MCWDFVFLLARNGSGEAGEEWSYWSMQYFLYSFSRAAIIKYTSKRWCKEGKGISSLVCQLKVQGIVRVGFFGGLSSSLADVVFPCSVQVYHPNLLFQGCLHIGLGSIHVTSFYPSYTH